jgi:protein-disulfide isomerase
VRAHIVRAALLALALVLPSTTPAAPAKKPAAAAKANWLATVRRTAEGAIVIGNPAAKVKLVEYLSLTCPHCADFSGEAMPPLQRDYIAKGLVSLEVRHAVRDPLDFTASLLLRCEQPTAYLGAIEALFATQPSWFERAQAGVEGPEFEALAPERKIPAIARAAGFDAFFARRGLTARAQAACMASKAGQDQLSTMTSNSWDRDKIPGTPLILLNGVRREEVKHWAQLEPLIRAALK